MQRTSPVVETLAGEHLSICVMACTCRSPSPHHRSLTPHSSGPCPVVCATINRQSHSRMQSIRFQLGGRQRAAVAGDAGRSSLLRSGDINRQPIPFTGVRHCAQHDNLHCAACDISVPRETQSGSSSSRKLARGRMLLLLLLLAIEIDGEFMRQA